MLLGVLILVSAITIVPYELSTSGGIGDVDDAPPSAPVVSPLPAGVKPRDIYFFIFDRYGSDRSIKLRYGITDNDLPGWLADRGFYVASNSHATYHETSRSVNSTLNMDFLENLPKGSIKNHAVGRFVKGLGYKYIHIGSNFGPDQSSTLADENMDLEQVSDFAAAFYDSTLIPGSPGWRASRRIRPGRASTPGRCSTSRRWPTPSRSPARSSSTATPSSPTRRTSTTGPGVT